jgi:hypothetical protein
MEGNVLKRIQNERKLALNIFDVFYFGWYHILDKTIYALGMERGVLGPREHSFFVVFLIHGINTWTILDFILTMYVGYRIPLYVSLAMAVLIFVVGYFVYFKSDRANKIISTRVGSVKATLFVLISVAYVVLSVYFMLKVGNLIAQRN